jgi:hypothetical protein
MGENISSGSPTIDIIDLERIYDIVDEKISDDNYTGSIIFNVQVLVIRNYSQDDKVTNIRILNKESAAQIGINF